MNHNDPPPSAIETPLAKARRVIGSDEVFLSSREWRALVRDLLAAPCEICQLNATIAKIGHEDGGHT